MNEKRMKNNIHDHKNQNKVEETYFSFWKEGKISYDQPLKECNLFQMCIIFFSFNDIVYV